MLRGPWKTFGMTEKNDGAWPILPADQAQAAMHKFMMREKRNAHTLGRQSSH